MKSSTMARLALAVLLTTFLFLLALYLLYQLQTIVVWGILALFLAIGLDPLVNLLERRGWPRSLAILTTYLLLLLVLAALAALVVPAFVDQTKQLINLLRTPGGLTREVDQLATSVGLHGVAANWHAQLDALPGQLARSLGSITSLETVTTGTATFVTGVATVAILGFFFVHDGPRMVESTVSLFPESRRPTARRILQQSAAAVSSYIRGNLTISFIAGVVVFVGMAILGIPYALPLALLLGILDLIPMIGAPLGAVPIVLSALTVSPIRALIILAYIVIYYQIESNVLNPLIYGRRDRLPALTVFASFLIGGTLFGILGALLAIPATNIIRVLIREWQAPPTPEVPTSTSTTEEADSHPGPEMRM